MRTPSDLNRTRPVGSALRIVSVYIKDPGQEDVQARDLVPFNMAYIRWMKIAEGLAALGHHVDLAVPDAVAAWPPRAASFRDVRRVALSKVDWSSYDVVKTVFHRGFETLEAFGGVDHPFIISKLGSVVGPRDMEGVHFYGKVRERLYATQQRIAEASRYVTVLTPEAGDLWRDCFGATGRLLLVPGGVDRVVPEANYDPYPSDGVGRVLFAGNVYDAGMQPEANRVLVRKLNSLGSLLGGHGARLYLLGNGDVTGLDPAVVRFLGTVPYEESWNYLWNADVGVALVSGSFLHNNESTKLYHYLRAGLPVVSEAGFPNNRTILESGLGFVVENADMDAMARKVVELLGSKWDRNASVRFAVEHHSWERRVEAYDALLSERFPAPGF